MKTVEVRKTRPKIETPFKCYIYCTNTKPYLVWGDVFRGNWETEFTHLSGYNRKAAEEIWDVFNGKVIGEFVCDSIFPIRVFENGTIRYHQSFGTSNSSKRTWRNVQTYGGPRTDTMWNYLPGIIFEICGRLKEAQIENIDAIELIKRYNDENTLIYCDPPYLQKLRKKNMYAHELSDEYHIKLLEVLKESKSKIVLSGYDNPIYNELLENWNSDTKQTTAQMGLHRVEKIWFNFEPRRMQTHWLCFMKESFYEE